MWCCLNGILIFFFNGKRLIGFSLYCGVMYVGCVCVCVLNVCVPIMITHSFMVRRDLKDIVEVKIGV